MTIAREWAAYCGRETARALPADVEARARSCLADHLHAAMHGARSATGAMLRSYLGAGAQASDVAAERYGAESLALYLGAIAAVHEIDDVHQDTSLHPGSVIVAAALAAARESDASGSRLLASIVAGYEVAIRLSVAAGHRHYHYFHATATCGCVGAAVAASVIYALDETSTAHAIGIAATSAAGLWEGINDEAVTIKHLHPGLAAERGVRAAKLARSGMGSANRSIEGEKGFLAALAQRGSHAPGEAPSADELAATLVANLGESPAIMRNIFKRYPFCLGCFEPLEGMRYLIDARSGDAADIGSVLVEASPSVTWMVGQQDPHDEFGAKFSAPYALALVLAGRDAEQTPLPALLLADREIRAWMTRIRVEGKADFGRRRARVTIELRGGTRESAERPFRNLDEARVWTRFGRAAREYLGDHGPRLERAVGACEQLARADELLPPVIAAICPPAPPAA